MKSALLFAALATPAVARGCPKDMSSLRSSLVESSFEPAKMSGFFYEVAYEDIMQKGETCQCFNETVAADGINEQFGFTYSNPGSSSVFFENTDTAGVYLKYMGSSTSGMPTVVVDVTENADGNYETVTEYTCSDDGKTTYEEIKIGARTPSVSQDTMDSIKKTLNGVGIGTDSLVYVDQEGCEYSL
jgi:hypothetical protein